MADMQGKTVIVTGAGSGIGRAAALAFARHGASVVVADVNESGGQETVKMIAQAGGAEARKVADGGGQAVFIRTDVSDESQVQGMVACAKDTFGGLDYAFNNAGIEGEEADTADCTLENWQRVISVNLTGVFLCCKHEVREMRNRGGGAIVNMSSILGKVAFPGVPAYEASKHGVIGLTKTVALENAVKGIRVNAVCPGIIETPMVMERGPAAGQHPDVYRQYAEMHPMKRLGKPEEIAAGAVWLCSDEASFVTGEALGIDGGFLAQ